MTPDIPASSALDEETARAEIYGLLAALYYAPPSPELLAQLRVAVTEAPAAGAHVQTIAFAQRVSELAGERPGF